VARKAAIRASARVSCATASASAEPATDRCAALPQRRAAFSISPASVQLARQRLWKAPSPRYFQSRGGSDAGALGPLDKIYSATEDFGVELTDDEHGTELCERWADRLALARMHFARGDLKALPTGDRRSGALCGLNPAAHIRRLERPCGAFSIFALVHVGSRTRLADEFARHRKLRDLRLS
jgi:hypothetical protein